MTYSDLQPGEYFVRLIAKIGTCATDRLRRKVGIPCQITKSSYRISKRYVIVKFTGVGIGGAPLTDFTCSVNGQTAQTCKLDHCSMIIIGGKNKHNTEKMAYEYGI